MRYKPAYMHVCACVCVCMHLVWGGEGLPELTEELVSAALSAWLEALFEGRLVTSVGPLCSCWASRTSSDVTRAPQGEVT